MKGRPEITITSKNQVSLPAASLKELGWQRGDKLIVNVLDNDTLVLKRRPESWTDYYSGKMGHVWGDHEDTLRYLDEERASWNERFPDLDADGD
ncbi:MAG TPA: AbrB/MazE/SpoVT family DNA-binding domain-containing protein [Chloroflexota bacterium]|nr:AbrB/MazE/SpoVT family DNA-binding domain-containing protein [Chloroflexota bacterium]